MRADQGVYPLGTGLTANGAAVQILGGNYMFGASGTVAGATVSLQVQLPDGTWANVQAMGGTANVQTTALPYTSSQVYLPPCYVRLGITGGTSPVVNGWLVGIG